MRSSGVQTSLPNINAFGVMPVFRALMSGTQSLCTEAAHSSHCDVRIRTH